MPSALDDDRSWRDAFLSVDGQTAFTPTRPCLASSILVILNGALITDRSAYAIATDGTVTLAVPRYDNETVDLVYTLA